jgi:hypothetical protein
VEVFRIMKKFILTAISLAIVLAIVIAAAVPVMAAPKVPAPPPEEGARVAVDFLNAGFHCNAQGGNGRVWVAAYDEMYQAAKNAKLKGVFEDLIYLADNSWLLADTETYVCPKCGSAVWVSYSNKSGVPDGKNIQLTHPAVPKNDGGDEEDGGTDVNSFRVAKFVNGVNIVEWASANNINFAAVAADMEFKLYTVYGAWVADGNLGSDGYVDFGNVKYGFYKVIETVSGYALKIFVDDVKVDYYFIGANGVQGTSSDFDYDARYWISFNIDEMVVLGYEGLNGDGEVFPMSVVDFATGNAIPTFCANASSVAFAPSYVVGSKLDTNGVSYTDFISAYNYIEDKFGRLEDNRILTQIVTWALLGSIDVSAAAFGAINADASVKEAAVEVMANYAGYFGNGVIVDVIYMVCENGGDYWNNQPQLVPVYGGEVVFNNILRDASDSDSAVTLTGAATGKDAKDITIVEFVKNRWAVTFTVTETYSDGTVKAVERSFTMDKNSKGQVMFDNYILSYDIAGNGSNVKTFEIKMK